MKNLKDVKDQLLANPAVRQAYDAQAPEFELACELIAARTKAGLTQGDVAARMGKVDSFEGRVRDIMAITSTRFDPEKQACAELEKSIQDVR
ncbi:hypothetical protein [Limnohabitans sp.]|uniref:hypothetical protein n=1 Tax=Limnohabitans sp. TaxID=1907725 RepID=UPI003341EDAF